MVQVRTTNIRPAIAALFGGGWLHRVWEQAPPNAYESVREEGVIPVRPGRCWAATALVIAKDASLVPYTLLSHGTQ